MPEHVLVRIVNQNLQHPAADWSDRLRAGVERLRPDLLLLQHVEDAATDIEQWRLGEMLAMNVAAAPIGDGTMVAVAFDQGQFEQVGLVESGGAAEDGFGYCAVRLQHRDIRIREQLIAVSCVLTRYSAPLAAQQAQRLGQLAHSGGGAGVIGGGINHVPTGDPEPDWDAIPAYRRMAVCRLKTGAGDPWTGDDLVARRLAAGGFVDIAARAAELFPSTAARLRAPTDKTARGFRGDQLHATCALAPTMRSCELVEQGISGHTGIIAELDLTRTDVNGLHAFV